MNVDRRTLAAGSGFKYRDRESVAVQVQFSSASNEVSTDDSAGRREELLQLRRGGLAFGVVGQQKQTGFVISLLPGPQETIRGGQRHNVASVPCGNIRGWWQRRALFSAENRGWKEQEDEGGRNQRTKAHSAIMGQIAMAPECNFRCLGKAPKNNQRVPLGLWGEDGVTARAL